jgi:hypothetical protein
MPYNKNKWYEQQGKIPPRHEPHGTEEDIAKNMRKLVPTDWKLVGNELRGTTEVGEIVQRIPPNYIMTGIGDDGLPILEKIKF